MGEVCCTIKKEETLQEIVLAIPNTGAYPASKEKIREAADEKISKKDTCDKSTTPECKPSIKSKDPQAIFRLVSKVQALFKGVSLRKKINMVGKLQPITIIKLCEEKVKTHVETVNKKEKELGPYLLKIDIKEYKGVLEWRKEVTEPNGDKYYGYWNITTKTKEGYGVQVFANGAKYEGFWKNGLQEINGRMIFENGDYYCGEWKAGKASGIGICICQDGSKYEGEWKDNYHDGKGKDIINNKVYYEGSYKEGYKEGKGILHLKNGAKYEGDFVKNKMEGKGIYYWSDGRKYEGDWKNNKMSGKGLYTFSDGSIYEGEFDDDLRNGLGHIKWKDGKEYVGTWRQGKMDGEGTLTNEAGDIQKGIWKEGALVKVIKTIKKQGSSPAKYSKIVLSEF